MKKIHNFKGVKVVTPTTIPAIFIETGRGTIHFDLGSKKDRQALTELSVFLEGLLLNSEKTH